MKYNLRLINILKSYIFRIMIAENHKILSEKTGYFSVFLNDDISNVVQTTGLYESEILIPLFNILSKHYNLKNNTAIDVGANIGNHTVFFSDFFNKVISFEPNPLTFKLLSVNTHFLQNVIVQNYGLSDIQKEAKLSVVKGNLGASSALIDYKSEINHLIKLVKLDDVYSNIDGDIALIKIDVEGMEEKVLIGAESIINNHLPIILFEQLNNAFENGISSSITQLENAGYYMYLLKESQYSSNKWLRRLKRLPLIFSNGSLTYCLEKTDNIKSKGYSMIIAIHKSKVNSDNLF